VAAYCLREKGQRGGRIETDGLAQAFCGIPFEPALSGAKLKNVLTWRRFFHMEDFSCRATRPDNSESLRRLHLRARRS
jgi:hypothetical protein